MLKIKIETTVTKSTLMLSTKALITMDQTKVGNRDQPAMTTKIVKRVFTRTNMVEVTHNREMLQIKTRMESPLAGIM